MAAPRSKGAVIAKVLPLHVRQDAARRRGDERFLLEEDAETLIRQAEMSDVLR